MGEDWRAVSLFRGAAWLSVSRFLSLLISFLANAILARMLEPSDFGAMAIVLVVLAFFDAFLDGLISIEISRGSSEGDVDVTLFAVIAIVFWFVMFVVSIPTAFFLENQYSIPGLSFAIILAAASMSFRSIERICEPLLRKRGQYRNIALYQVLSPLIVYVPVSFALAFWGAGYWSLIIGYVCVVIFSSLFVSRMANVRLAGIVRSFNLDGLGNIPAMLNGHNYGYAFSSVVGLVSQSIPGLMLGRILGVDHLGIYSRSWSLFDIVNRVASYPLQDALIPALSGIGGYDSNKLLKVVFPVSLYILTVISIMCFYSRQDIVSIALGYKWREAGSIVGWLFLCSPLLAAYKIIESHIISTKSPGFLIIIQFYYLISMSVCAIFFAIRGAEALSLSILAYHLTLFGFVLVYIIVSGLDDIKGILAILGRVLILGAVVYLMLLGFDMAVIGQRYYVSFVGRNLIASMMLLAMIFILPASLWGRDISVPILRFRYMVTQWLVGR